MRTQDTTNDISSILLPVARLLSGVDTCTVTDALRSFGPFTYPADRSETNFFTGDPLRSLSTLSYSENVDLQRSAALAFAEITEKYERCFTQK